MNDDYIFLITTYNCHRYIDNCISSLLTQKDKNFGILFMDDASTDGTVERIRAIMSNQSINYIIHSNETRTRSAAWNQRKAVLKYVKNPNSQICILDGDDELMDDDAFNRIKSAEGLSRRKYEAGVLGFKGRLPSREVNIGLYRFEEPYHMRYFNAWLYKAVPESTYYRDGEMIKAASDIAFIMPVIQLLNKDFGMCNLKVYIWNNHLGSHNDHFIRLGEQRSNLEYVLTRDKMKPLTKEQIQEIKDNWDT